ncbi:MAG: F0F1 ATP synthase subunit gamma [Alphaproteobacteria bacterium]
MSAGNLKQIKGRITSVTSTRKITTAMKQIASAKLKRAQERAKGSGLYHGVMAEIVSDLAQNVKDSGADNLALDGLNGALLLGRDVVKTHLVVVATSERGLCGGFNTNVVKAAIAKIKELKATGVDIKIIAIGRKGAGSMRRLYGDAVIDAYPFPPSGRQISFDDVKNISQKIFTLYDEGVFDACSIVYSNFVSVIAQEPSSMQVIPATLDDSVEQDNKADQNEEEKIVFDYEPSSTKLIEELITRNIYTQLYKALLETEAGMHGARVTAMDNASRNAGDMIKKLTLQYNRARQAQVTTELIEIISGAEAV